MGGGGGGEGRFPGFWALGYPGSPKWAFSLAERAPSTLRRDRRTDNKDTHTPVSQGGVATDQTLKGLSREL